MAKSRKTDRVEDVKKEGPVSDMDGSIRSEVLPAVPMDDAVASLVSSGINLIRLENETQIQLAAQRPRDEAMILKKATSELEVYPSLAEEAIYVKPVGRSDKCAQCGAKTFYNKNCPQCNAEVPMTYARGLSVRAAESLANRWANSAWGRQELGEDDDKAFGVAIFLDYELNIRHAVPYVVSKWYKQRKGSLAKMDEDRFHDLKLKAEGSKALREVILRSLPAGLKEEYRRKAEALISKSDDATKNKMLKAFAGLGVTKEMLEEFIGIPVSEFTADSIVMLRGMFNAIEDGEMTIQSVFRKGGQDGNGAINGAPKASDVIGVGDAKE